MTSLHEKFSFSRLVLALMIGWVLIAPNVSWGQGASSNEACLEGKSSKESIAAAEAKRKAEEGGECAKRAKKMDVMCPDGVTVKKKHSCKVEAKCKLQGQSCESIRNKIKAAEKARNKAFDVWDSIGNKVAAADKAANDAQKAVDKATEAWKKTSAYKNAMKKSVDAAVADVLAAIEANNAEDALDEAISATSDGRIAISNRKSAQQLQASYEDYAREAYELAQKAKAPGATEGDKASAAAAALGAKLALEKAQKEATGADKAMNKAIKQNPKARKAAKAARDAQRKADKAKRAAEKADKDLENTKPPSLKNAEKKAKDAKEKADKAKKNLQKQLDDARKRLDELQKRLDDLKDQLKNGIACQVSSTIVAEEKECPGGPVKEPEEPTGKLKEPKRSIGRLEFEKRFLGKGEVFTYGGQQFALPTNVTYSTFAEGVETMLSPDALPPVVPKAPASKAVVITPPSVIKPSTGGTFESQLPVTPQIKFTKPASPQIGPLISPPSVGIPSIGVPRIGGGGLR